MMAVTAGGMFFDSWHGLLRVLVVGVLAYTTLILLLRISGKRTLAKMNAFDLVVTVALGSTLASVVTSKDVALIEGILALGLLIGLQFAVAWTVIRWPWFDRLVKAEPVLLFYKGRFVHAALRRERVTEGEVIAAIRGARLSELDQVDAVVLESAGELSVMRSAGNLGRADTLTGVQGTDLQDQMDSRG